MLTPRTPTRQFIYQFRVVQDPQTGLHWAVSDSYRDVRFGPHATVGAAVADVIAWYAKHGIPRSPTPRVALPSLRSRLGYTAGVRTSV